MGRVLLLSISGVGETLRGPGTAKKTNQWVMEQISPESSLEAQMTRLKLPYLGRILQGPSSLGEALVLGRWKEREEDHQWRWGHHWKARLGRDCSAENLSMRLLGVNHTLMAPNPTLNPQ